MSTDNRFDYQGYLIFNGLYKTNTESAGPLWTNLYDTEAHLLDEFGEFEREYRSSSKGVEKLLLRDYIRDDESIDEDIQSIADDLIPFRFLYEEMEEYEGYPEGNGELQLVDVPVVNDSDIYWVHPDYIFFRGSEGDSKEAIEATQGIMRTGASVAGEETPDLEPLEFSEDFLLWLFCQHFYDNSPWPNSEVSIDELSDASVSGEDDIWGGENVVGDTSGLEGAPPLLQAILKHKKLSMLEGTFRIFDLTVLAEIQKDKVHVKVAKDINRSNKTRRVALSSTLLKNLAELVEYWENLQPVDKYPAFGFFQDLHQTCSGQGAPLDRISPGLRREYCDKRGEARSDWDL